MNIEITVLNSTRFIKLLIAASRWISKYSDVLNDLNVYPIPDGDTGTNMAVTLQSVESELIKLNHEPDMEELCEIVSEALILGSRGTSGTILTQIFQGFFECIKTKDEISVDDVKKAFNMAREKSFNIVDNPIEGSMLTVIDTVAEAAQNYTNDSNNFIPFLTYLKEAAREAVNETPNQLKSLKEAGVVDAGGQGIFYIIEGFEKSITDIEMLKDLERIIQSQTKRKNMVAQTENFNIGNLKFKYHMEFIIETSNFNLDDYKLKLIKDSDSVVFAQTSNKTKTYLNTNSPGLILEIANEFGNLSNIKIDNLEIQHKNLNVSDSEQNKFEKKGRFLIQNENSKPFAFFAIADNLELGNLFLNTGATAVLIGNESHHLNLRDIEEGISKIKANEIILLPNNKNLIPLVRAASEKSDKNITIIETSSMLEGYYVIKNKEVNIQDIIRHLTYNTSIEIISENNSTTLDQIETQNRVFVALINGESKLKSNTLEDLIQQIYKSYLTDNSLNIFACIGKNSTEEGNVALKSIQTKINYSDIIIGQDRAPYYIYITNRNPELSDIAIVTDSTSDLTEDMIRNLPIDIIPLKIKFDEENYYKDGIDLSRAGFWEKLIASDKMPKTSHPSPAEFKELYEKLFERGYKKIISIHVSSKLSGTQQSARVARGMLNRDDDIAVIDSKLITFALAHLALESAKLAKQNNSFESIVQWIEETKNKIKLYFVLKDLKYLENGGRIGRASSLIGGFFKMKPVLKLENGEISVEYKSIGEKGAMLYMEKLIKKEKNSLIMYTGWGGNRKESELADKLRAVAEKNKKIDYRGRIEVGATVASHTGPLYGISILNKLR